MNKSELVSAVAKKTGQPEKIVHQVITDTVDVIMKQVSKNDEVRLIGFGTFSKKKRAARKYTDFEGNVRKAKAKMVPAFSAGEVFKRKVQGKK